MKKVIICPDKFKGSLTAMEASIAIDKGVKDFDTSIHTVLCPLADGGEGSIDIINNRINGKRIDVKVNGPLGQPTESYFIQNDLVAFIEMAKASGLALISSENYNPLEASTYGTGELIREALDLGCNEIYLFIGGSATNDGGMGMARALGYRFLDKEGLELKGRGKDLIRVKKIEHENINLAIHEAKFKVVCDVKNPFYGPNGSAYVYAAQKGAKPHDIDQLDRGLKNLSNVIESEFGLNISEQAGSGAAGGLGGGAISFLNAEMVPGVQTVMQLIAFDTIVQDTDILISGEGKMDLQSLHGKVIDGVAEFGRRNDVDVALLVGKNELIQSELDKLKIVHCQDVLSISNSTEDAMKKAGEKLRKLAYNLTRHLANS